MCALRLKSVLGQASVIVCLLLALLVFDPVLARSQGELHPVHSDLVGNPINGGMGKNSLASIRIDTASQFITEVVDIPILIRNDVEFGKFELQIDFCYQNLTFVGAQRGEALSDITDEEYDWELFTYYLLPYNDTLYRCFIYGLYDAPDGHPGVPLAPNSDYVSLVVLQFVSNYGEAPPGTFFPVAFEWEMGDCLENTLQDPSFETLYVSQDSLQFNTIDCPPESVNYLPVSSSLEFLDGGVYVFYPSTRTGDINLNWIPYEAADWVLFQQFLLYGDSLLTDPEQQAVNSDVNCEYLPWSIADLLYMCRVILHEAPAIPCKGQESGLPKYLSSWQDTTDELMLVSSSAHPGEVVSVPIWLANSIPARGITFKVVFDSTLLSVEGVDTSQTRIVEWEEIHPVINPGELFFFAYPDWWEFPQFPLCLESGEGMMTRINFRVDENAPAGAFIPVTFETEEDLGHYNSYTDTTGLILIQPSTASGWIFTDVISGDANSDGIVDVADLIYLINYLYRWNKPPSPLSLGDFYQDGEVNLADVLALINFLFRS